MSYVGRSRDTLRDQLLSLWTVQYAALSPPQRLLTAPGSDAYLWASALAVMLEALEAQAEANARNILPDQADTESLNRHGYVDGVDRRVGTVARHSVTVTNAANGVKNIPIGTQFAYSDGTLYGVAETSVTITAGVGKVTAVALVAGSAGTRTTGQTMVFVSTPTGLDSVGTVALSPTLVPGNNEESDALYAARIISFRQERPGSGNRSQWREWVESYIGTPIATAYVYPLLEPPATYPGFGAPDVPGCVTVVAVGPAQGSLFENTRIVPSDDGSSRTSGSFLPLVRGYIEGTHTNAGILTDTGTQLRPVTMLPENASVEAISTTTENVTLTATNAESSAFPWTGSYALTAATATTLEVAGDRTSLNGLDALVLVDATGTLNTRGGYRRYTLPLDGAYDGGTNRTTWTFVDAFPDTPSGTLYPAPLNYEAVRDAAFTYFDALGPGDTTPPSRWPPESQEARSTFYRPALVASVLSTVPSVLSAEVTAPAGDVAPPAKTVVVLGRFLMIAF